MDTQVICTAHYEYGNLVYLVSIVKEQGDIDWETEHKITDERYFVEYVEDTLPSRNRVGGFVSLDEALAWVDSKFGQLQWSYFPNGPVAQ